MLIGESWFNLRHCNEFKIFRKEELKDDQSHSLTALCAPLFLSLFSLLQLTTTKIIIIKISQTLPLIFLNSVFSLQTGTEPCPRFHSWLKCETTVCHSFTEKSTASLKPQVLCPRMECMILFLYFFYPQPSEC